MEWLEEQDSGWKINTHLVDVPWNQLVTAIQERPDDAIQVNDASCWVSANETAIQPYTLQIQSNTGDLLHLSGPSPQACEYALNTLVSKQSSLTVTAFARQPRQELPSCTSTIEQLHLSFLHVLSVSNVTQFLELRQCTVQDYQTLHCKHLTLSCPLPEFATLVETDAWLSLTSLTLKLHVWLQGPAFETFCDKLPSCQELAELHISYLDLQDEQWERLLTSLPPSLERLHMSFTDNFVDAYRRLTPERRTRRSQILLQNIGRLQHVSWPQCQQDEIVAVEVEKALQANRLETGSVSLK